MKNKKIRTIALSGIAIVSLFSATKVLAQQAEFYFEIPKAKGWVNTEDGNGNGYISGASSKSADISLEAFRGISKVTFYAGAWKNNGNDSIKWNSTGKVMSLNDFNEGNTDGVVPYKEKYNKGQKMGIKARNHNWSLNKGDVTATIDYH